MSKYIPQGYHTLTPALTVKDARKAIAFYKKAFDAQELFVLPTPDGKHVMHAELQIGDSRLMLGEENPAWPDCRSAETLKGSPISLSLYVPDADASFKKAVAAGAKAKEQPNDAFWGDRHGAVVDPFGYVWSLLTHKKDLTPEQIRKGAEEFMTQAVRR